jgi:rhodanese-related sulfurtransferase
MATRGSVVMSRGHLLFIVGSFFLILALGHPSEPNSEQLERMDLFHAGAGFNVESRHSFLNPNIRNYKLHIFMEDASTDCVQVLCYPRRIVSRGNEERRVCWLSLRPGEKPPGILLENDFAARRSLSFEAAAGLQSAPAGVRGELTGPGDDPGRNEIPDEWIARKKKKRDPALMVSVEDVLPGSKVKSETILIDVRPRHEFKKMRIPGSINIDLFAIKTKTFLKAQPIVLASEGYRYGQLEEETRRLRHAGFTVAILDGGLTRWRWIKGPLEGDAFAQRELNRVPPQVFFEERDYDHWVVMDATNEPLQWSRRLIPASVPLASSTDAKALAGQMKAILARHKMRPFPLFLIFDERGENYERIEGLVSASGIPHVYFLRGGINGYRAFLEQQASLLQSSGPPEKRAGRCTSCP